MKKQELRPKIVKLCKVVGGFTGVVNKIDADAPAVEQCASGGMEDIRVLERRERYEFL